METRPQMRLRSQPASVIKKVSEGCPDGLTRVLTCSRTAFEIKLRRAFRVSMLFIRSNVLKENRRKQRLTPFSGYMKLLIFKLYTFLSKSFHTIHRGTIEQNLPQSCLKVHLWALQQERGSRGQCHLVRVLRHIKRLG